MKIKSSAAIGLSKVHSAASVDFTRLDAQSQMQCYKYCSHVHGEHLAAAINLNRRSKLANKRQQQKYRINKYSHRVHGPSRVQFHALKY